MYILYVIFCMYFHIHSEYFESLLYFKEDRKSNSTFFQVAQQSQNEAGAIRRTFGIPPIPVRSLLLQEIKYKCSSTHKSWFSGNWAPSIKNRFVSFKCHLNHDLWEQGYPTYNFARWNFAKQQCEVTWLALYQL